MARYRGKKALYEVMSKSRIKPGAAKTVEPLNPKKDEPQERLTAALINPPEGGQNDVKKPVAEKLQAATQWWKKPRILQLNAGRIEFSLPYQIAIAIVLGLILLILIVYRLGQLSISGQKAAGPLEGATNNAQVNPPGRINPTGQESIRRTPQADSAMSQPPVHQNPVPAQSAGKNVIVLAEYGARADLEPVRKFFAQYGIELEIVVENGRYFLQTKNTYDNPDNAGTDGYKAKQNIIKTGAAYKGKAPEGYETFAPRYFSDAYGKKVK